MSLKAIRKRIISVKNTQKITKAMKMVAAAKLRRAQDSVNAIRPYARRMFQVVTDLAERMDEAPVLEDEQGEPSAEERRKISADLLLKGRDEARIRLVVITSDRGLAGAFNSNVNRSAERFLVEHAGAQVEIDVIGKKGRDYLRRRRVKIAHELPGVEGKTAAARAEELRHELMVGLAEGQFDAVYAIYNEFKTVSSQAVRVERLLPLREPEHAAPGPAADDKPRLLVDFVYEPDKAQVLQHLLPLHLQTEIHRILLESIASEFGARMSAMDNASRNAKEMISRLTLEYNRARQAAITKELMEIVGGAEALKG